MGDEKSGEPKTVKVLEDRATLVIIRSNGKVFGGYANEPWGTDGLTFGTARCFLFSMSYDIKIPFHGRETLEPPPRSSRKSDSRRDRRGGKGKKRVPPRRVKSKDDKSSTEANNSDEDEDENGKEKFKEKDSDEESFDSDDSYFQSFG